MGRLKNWLMTKEDKFHEQAVFKIFESNTFDEFLDKMEKVQKDLLPHKDTHEVRYELKGIWNDYQDKWR